MMKYLLVILLLTACVSTETEELKIIDTDSVQIETAQNKALVGRTKPSMRWGVYAPDSIGDTAYVAIYSDERLKYYRIIKLVKE